MEDNLQEQPSLGQPLPEVPPVETETASRTYSTETTLMTLGASGDLPGRNTIQSTVSMVSPSSAGRHVPNDRVSVKIEYPKSWKKERHFKDGDIKEVAKETADQFIKAGFATMVNEHKAE